MVISPDVAYWDRGVLNVPDMTGASRLLDAVDLHTVFVALGLMVPLEDVLDVGCGTGRLAQICQRYRGVDIAPSAVEYCRRQGLDVSLIHGSDDLPTETCHLVTAISVFTHVSRLERQDYLRRFVTLAPALVADIIPGDGSGDVAKRTSRPEGFEADLVDAGYDVVCWTEHRWGAHLHRYYRAVLA